MTGLKLLSNEVIAKIFGRLKFFETMASRLVEAGEEFIEETQVRTKTQKSRDYWTNIFQQWAKTRGKNEQLERYEVPEINEALDNFFFYVINK